MHSKRRDERPEARRLDVEVPDRDRQRVDVGERVDRRVEREPVRSPRERLEHVGLERRVLDHGVREALGDRAWNAGVRHRVDRRAA